MAIPTVESLLEEEVIYPDADGEPVDESDFQLFPLVYAVQALKWHFRNHPMVYVSGNSLIYYEKGQPGSVISPDVFVVFGVPKRDRRSFLLWKEAKVPDFVIEITSKTTWVKDQSSKKGIYAFLGVREYFQYDPTGDYLEPRLQGFRLVDRNYLPIPAEQLTESILSVHSNTLGLDLRLENDGIRFYDPDTEEKILSYDEMEQARQTAEQARLVAEKQAQTEKAARQAAENRLVELEALLRTLQGKP